MRFVWNKLELQLQRMSRLNSEPVQSDYYPQRARWYSRAFYPWFALRRGLHMESIRLPSRLSMAQFVLSLIVPGYAFFANGRRVLGWAFLAVYFNATLLFIARRFNEIRTPYPGVPPRNIDSALAQLGAEAKETTDQAHHRDSL